MSYYQFIASNNKLPDLENEKLVSLSINEAYEMGLVEGAFGLAPEEVLDLYDDKDAKGAVIHCENEEDFDELSIIEEDFNDYSSAYTDKEFCSAISWRPSEERIEKLIKYVKDQMEITDEIELWTIILDDEDECEAEIITCSLEDLDSETVSDAMEIDEYSGPICLKIIKC